LSAYLKFFQLEKSPFESRAQSALVLGTKALRTAFAEIEAGLEDGAPRICVDGKAGLGKTSLARALPKLLSASSRVVLILNPSLPWSTLRSAIVKQLDLAEGNLSRKTLMRARSEGRKLVIVIDQAERISSESLDHLDILLGYKNDDDEQLCHCVLLANLEAAASQHNEQGEQTPLLWWLDKLNTLQLEFQPIPVAGVTSYVNKHLKRAGWKGGQIFTPDALQTIHRLTGGVPREMSALCERALELAAEEETSHVDAQLVEDVFGEIPLEEVVDEEGDVTDSAFVGPRDDYAPATTTTFGGERPRAAAARAFDDDADASNPRAFDDDEPSGASNRHAFGTFDRTEVLDPDGSDADSTSEAGTARRDPRADPSPTPGVDRAARIDRMPTPGRTVHAPVDAPISLDTFFGDSLGGAKALPTPRAETAAHVEDGPALEAPGLASEAEAPKRGSLARWLGVAAGVLLVAGGGGFAALSLLGGGDRVAEPPVIARPKPTQAPAAPPVAGIETEDLHISPRMAAAAAARARAETALEADGDLGALAADAEAGDAAARGATAGTETGATGALPEVDPLDLDSPERAAEGASDEVAVLEARPLDAAATDATSATSSGSDVVRAPSSAPGPSPSPAPGPAPGPAPSPAAPAAQTSPAAPDPTWRNPAESEVDAPYW